LFRSLVVLPVGSLGGIGNDGQIFLLSPNPSSILIFGGLGRSLLLFENPSSSL